MGYVRAIIAYIQTEKARHDIADYLRAIIIMAAVMTAIRIGVEIVRKL